MGKIEYFTFDGHCFELHTIHNVCKVRFTNNEGKRVVSEDTNLGNLKNKARKQFEEVNNVKSSEKYM